MKYPAVADRTRLWQRCSGSEVSPPTTVEAVGGVHVGQCRGAFRERPVELDAVWRGDSSNHALLRLLRDVLPQREWTTDDLVEDVLA